MTITHPHHPLHHIYLVDLEDWFESGGYDQMRDALFSALAAAEPLDDDAAVSLAP